jgi:hypothetical protein
MKLKPRDVSWLVTDHLHMAILFRILRRIATKISRIHYQSTAMPIMPILWAHEKARGVGWDGTVTEHFLSHRRQLYTIYFPCSAGKCTHVFRIESSLKFLLVLLLWTSRGVLLTLKHDGTNTEEKAYADEQSGYQTQDLKVRTVDVTSVTDRNTYC